MYNYFRFLLNLFWMIRIWNQAEMLINDEVITTSGFVEVILDVLNSSIEVDMVEKSA